MDMMTTANILGHGVEPFSLKDAPALIERLWPAVQISVESEVERGAGRGQTLPALGGYWKGRKPLVLVRACVLGALLPCTEDLAEDLAIFEALMQIDDDAFVDRAVNMKAGDYSRLAVAASVSEQDLSKFFEPKLNKKANSTTENLSVVDAAHLGQVAWRPGSEEAALRRFKARVLSHLPYAAKVDQAIRAEEVGAGPHRSVWQRVNGHLGTNAASLDELVLQLGSGPINRIPTAAGM